MGNKFDMISAAESGSINNLNLLNETFHVFSKSPASNVTTLGGARLKSGHTTTASDVWADEIPAFFSAANQAKFDLFSTLAVKDDLCIFGGKVYQHNGTQFVSLGTEAEVLVDGATFQKNNKDVIKYHKNRTAINLTADNNNGDGSNDLSAKIYDAATGSTNFVSQFISSTDKMVAGVPSLAYDATVVAGGVKLAEGLTNDNDYICNAYAGVIQFNKARSSGVTVSAWEYIGDKLTTSISDLRQSIKDISDVTLKGVVASVTADANTAQKAGITVDNTVSTTPVIKLTTGSVATGETKLVTGDAVKTYVDTTALADGGSIAQKISSAINELGDVAVKSDIAINDIKVKVGSGTATSLTPVNKSVTIEIPDAPEAVVTTEGTVTTDGFTKTAAVTSLANAAISAATATVGADGSVAEANDGLVKASDAVKIAEKAAAGVDVGVTGITINNGTKQTGDVAITAVTGVINAGASAGSLPSGGNEHGVTLNLVDNKAYVVVDTADYDPVNKKFKTEFASTNYLTTAADVTAYVTDAIADVKSTADSAIQGITLNGDTVNSSKWVTVNENNIANITLPKLGFNPNFGDSSQHGFNFSSNPTEDGEGISNHYIGIAAAAYTPLNREDAGLNNWSEETAGKWADATSDYFTTASSVKLAISDAVSVVSSDLTALENKVNAYHEAGVSYKVHTGTTLPDLSVEQNVKDYKNVILLVPSLDNGVLYENEAIAGGYVEYLCVKTGETTYAWEKIGTTEADLQNYVRMIENDNTPNEHTSPVYASISSNGYLSLGIDSATSTKLGVSKMFTGDIAPGGHTDVTDTAVSLHSTAKMYGILSSGLDLKANAEEVVRSINGVAGDIKLCVHNYRDSDYASEGGGMAGNLTSTTHANLWGMGIVTNNTPSNDEDIFIVDSFVGMSASYLTTASLPSSAVSVENNFVYNSQGTVITTIRPERMVSGFDATDARELTSFVGDLSNLESAALDGNAVATFYFCSALTTFIGDLSSLTNGKRMFESTGLTTFVSDLSSLTEGDNMFWSTSLSLESVENIADSINEYEGNITITWKSTPSEDKRQVLVDALSLIVDKGWRLATNSELIPLFDSEKYQTGYQTVQPLDLDSEPQTVYYVVKK